MQQWAAGPRSRSTRSATSSTALIREQSRLIRPTRSSVLGQVNRYDTSTWRHDGRADRRPARRVGSLYNDAYNISSLNYSITQAQAAGQSPNDPDRSAKRRARQPLLPRQPDGAGQHRWFGDRVLWRASLSTALVNDPVGHRSRRCTSSRPATTSAATQPGLVPTPSGPAGRPPGSRSCASAAGAGTSAASQLANTTVGGSLGSLIGLAGYSYSGVRARVRQPRPARSSRPARARPDYATSAAAATTARSSARSGRSARRLTRLPPTSLINEVNNPTVDYNGTSATQTSTAERRRSSPPSSDVQRPPAGARHALCTTSLCPRRDGKW